MVLAASPVFVNVVRGDVPTSAQFVQVAPRQRSIRYSVTATLSVDGVQLRSIRAVLTPVAARPVGVVGGVVSGAAGVVADAMSE